MKTSSTGKNSHALNQNRLINGIGNKPMDDVKQLMQHHYLKYASYVILDRAIPNVCRRPKTCAAAHSAHAMEHA